MRKIAILLYGPPGAGKGTQANLLAHKLNIIHFDTGRFLESVINDPNRQKEKVIKREKKLFDTGILTTPSFVFREIEKYAKKINRSGWGLVFSGSPRTLYEAKRLLPALAKLYGKKNIIPFVLDLPEDDSVARNSVRLTCSTCDYALLSGYYPSRNPKNCPVCAGKFYRRTLDKPDVIRNVRLKEYRNRTEPIFKLMEKMGYKIKKIDARPSPYKVFGKILRHIKTIIS